MSESAQELRWRAELEAAGERAVRDNLNSRGSLVTGGEPKATLHSEMAQRTRRGAD
jgi:hypothetical protein